MKTWKCPEYRRPSREEVEAASTFYRALKHSVVNKVDPIKLAGLELRAVLMSLRPGTDRVRGDNDFWRRKCQAVLLRPAIEPIAYSYWSKVSSLDIEKQTALKIASALAGGPLVYRKGPAIGKSANGDVHFPPLDDQEAWLAKIGVAARTPALAPVLPAIAFAQTVLTHPFSDGNGRFARLMVHAALGRRTGLHGPTIALAPAFYRHAEALGAALTLVSEQGDWTTLYRVFFSALADALVTTRALQRICDAS